MSTAKRAPANMRRRTSSFLDLGNSRVKDASLGLNKPAALRGPDQRRANLQILQAINKRLKIQPQRDPAEKCGLGFIND